MGGPAVTRTPALDSWVVDVMPVFLGEEHECTRPQDAIIVREGSTGLLLHMHLTTKASFDDLVDALRGARETDRVIRHRRAARTVTRDPDGKVSA